MEKNMVSEKTFTSKALVIKALFAADLCVSAYISIPLPTGAHITFLNFIVLLIALVFPWQDSLVITLLWLVLGAIGIPVFIGGNAGIGYLLSGWGGYSFSFIIVAVLLPLLRSKKYNRLAYTILSLAGAVVIDIIGTAWLMAITHISITQAFMMGFLPFIPLDALKAIVVAQIVPQFQKLITFSSES